jgi:hypothetical protein
LIVLEKINEVDTLLQGGREMGVSRRPASASSSRPPARASGRRVGGRAEQVRAELVAAGAVLDKLEAAGSSTSSS